MGSCLFVATLRTEVGQTLTLLTTATNLAMFFRCVLLWIVPEKVNRVDDYRCIRYRRLETYGMTAKSRVFLYSTEFYYLTNGGIDLSERFLV